MTNVTWKDAQAYAKWAGVHLPTEAQWERAARFGTKNAVWPWGRSWDDTGVNAKGLRGNTTPAGSYAAIGPLGLFDMAGNVAEWTLDWYGADSYVGVPKRDPKGPTAGKARVIRGGSFGDTPGFLRSAFRDVDHPGSAVDDLGFRCVRVSRQP